MTADPVKRNFEHACPVCGDKEHTSFLCRVDGADVYSCATCAADHVFPMPSEQALKAYYDRREWFEGGEKGGYDNYDAHTAGSLGLLEQVLAPFAGRHELSILDVGCGYGTHLAAAAGRGWRCFGVEPSAHARAVAQERLGGNAYVVESIADLIPHEFDIILMLDVIEHLRSPYPTFYQLFSIGAITAKTTVIITTPNAGSAAARRDPAAWPYRHPASHLIHYAPQSLAYLFKRLHFTTIAIKGPGAEPKVGDDLSGCEGLVATASGSDFAEFMRERYVPGTWSKLAEYEHLPRYALAKPLAAGKTVLDFGCGTGYGAAMLAEAAAQVVGLDIDDPALAWAQENHRSARLTFRRHDDLGAALPAASFDLVTCFEMIEHVDHQTQKAVVAGIARLLRDDGLLIISTPNPDVTARYGANPYHLREMSETEFRELLDPHFSHVHILRQYVHVGVAINHDSGDARLTPGQITENGRAGAKPLAYIALCSRRPLPAIANRILYDQDTDYIEQFLQKEAALNKVRLEAYLRGQASQNFRVQFERTLCERDSAQAELIQERASAEAALHAKVNELATLQAVRAAELNSPRFLARRLWHATWARLRRITGL